MEKRKQSHGKSEGTRYLKKEFAAALVECPEERPVKLFCLDALQTFRKLNPHERPITGREGISIFANEIRKKLLRHDEALKHVAVCFDVSEFVPEAKAEEQKSRDRRTEMREEDREFVSAEELYLERVKEPDWPRYGLDLELPQLWEPILHDRDSEKGRNKLIRFFVRHMLAGPVQLPLPPGVTVYFLGHCFGEDEWSSFGLAASDAPVAMKVDFHGGRRVFAATDLTNKVGEAEFQMAFLHERLAKGEPVALRSTDSDVLYVALINRMNALWIYDSGKAMDVAAFSEHLHAQGLPYEDPAWALAACAYAAGSDYTFPWGGLTHKHFMDAFFDVDSRIPPDFCVDGEVSADGFLALLLAAFSRSRRGEYRLLDLPEARERGFAGKDFVTDRFLQLSYALAMLKHSSDPRAPDLEPLDYAYERVSDGKLLKKSVGRK